MNHIFLRKHHKWFGIPLCFLIIMFCFSGIILNHRTLVADINVDRGLLPSAYRYSDWNNGIFRGTLRLHNGEASNSVLIYGNNGIWRYDSGSVTDFNAGLPSGVDYRNIKGMTITSGGEIFAASMFGLYRYHYSDSGPDSDSDSGFDSEWQYWEPLNSQIHDDEKLTDICMIGDTLVVLGRSYVYRSLPPYHNFERIELKAPEGYDGKVSLFKTVWMLHSGELFGLAGKIFVDLIGLLLSLICITGLVFWLLPKYMRYKRKSLKDNFSPHLRKAGKTVKYSLLIHDRLGRYTFPVLLFLVITGWSLRPPVLLALVFSESRPVPYTKLDSSNPWNDKLRMLRYDSSQGDWILSTSDGFFTFRSFDDVPLKIEKTPPVSVMGLNVFQKENTSKSNTVCGGDIIGKNITGMQDSALCNRKAYEVVTEGEWIVGSFSGLYRWNREKGTVTDYFTGDEVEDVSGPPFGKYAVAGYSEDFTPCDLSKKVLSSSLKTSAEQDNQKVYSTYKPLIVEYYGGTDLLPMPEDFSCLPISLWNLALEIHTGRIYTFLGDGTLFYIFCAGLASIWCLFTGWKVRKKK